jgi:hypothetical protein
VGLAAVNTIVLPGAAACSSPALREARGRFEHCRPRATDIIERAAWNGRTARRAGLGHRDTSRARPDGCCAERSPGFFILNASAIDSRLCGNGSIAYSSIALSGTTKSRGRAVFIEKISSIS